MSQTPFPGAGALLPTSANVSSAGFQPATTFVDGAQAVIVEVAMGPKLDLAEVTATLRRTDGQSSYVLVDDGSIIADRAGDRIKTGLFVGPRARFVELELRVADEGAPQLVYRRNMALRDVERSHLSFFLEKQDGELLVTPVSWLPLEGRSVDTGSSIGLLVAFGWGALCLLYVGILVLRYVRAR